ncbi:YiiX/YebB-like N1pC/P60 family cysteine hydrolase [Neptuniibacter marinus]|uniref:YiiX/YebB-like N1pC/P60 family cysteine hydrolase n=1 Tax=Neptuniibacter marinus TaxID=1806670 RepID=UPI000834D753|nr:YiiX/YebB-like N1pC/P60 family cysteine hydrolase [Neptuniibacter marinus]
MNTQQLDQLEKEITNKVKEGDIIFISINSFLYRQVAKGTGSWTSHVGFIVREDNEWYVLESAVPKVTRCPLRKFLSRTTNNEVSVMRVKEGLNQEQITKLKTVAETKMGRYYHLGFKYDSKRQFCSKFVHLTFKEALGIEIGKVQTLEVLLQENPQASVNFWRCWYLGFVPWQRKTITPASQLNDPKLVPVYTQC